MPIYSFECKKCGNIFDESLPISIFKAKKEESVTKCYSCGEGIKNSDIVITGAPEIQTEWNSEAGKYRNSRKGPRPVIGGKVRDDIKPNWK